MWIYNQSNGNLSHNGALVGVGYSGHEAGLNNPAMEADPGVGPIPRGMYAIGDFYTDPEKGPLVAHLLPQPGTDEFGRSGFMLHGDTAADVENGTKLASEGCIVMARAIREIVANSDDNDLMVA